MINRVKPKGKDLKYRTSNNEFRVSPTFFLVWVYLPCYCPRSEASESNPDGRGGQCWFLGHGAPPFWVRLNSFLGLGKTHPPFYIYHPSLQFVTSFLELFDEKNENNFHRIDYVADTILVKLMLVYVFGRQGIMGFGGELCQFTEQQIFRYTFRRSYQRQ